MASSIYSEHPGQYNQGRLSQNAGGYTATYEHTNASAYQNIHRGAGAGYDSASYIQKSPKASDFPKLREAGQNVPMSDDEKEEVLERARPMVLNSNDPDMQLAWAQDALSWVEVAKQARAIDGTDGRAPTPTTEHQLRVDALNIVSFLAEQHHPKAEFMKGMWLEFGKFGYPVDKKEAFLSYRRAADTNTHGDGAYARAEYRMGMAFENTNDTVKALNHYRKGVAMHDSASNYRLGMMTLLGQHGQQQDYARGLQLIRYAADTADENAPQGAYVYGMLLSRELPNINIPEQFLSVDIGRAKEYVEKAAYLGFAKAQLKMGLAYELCQLGCDFNPALSLHYDALAARQGEAEADMAISKWFLCGYDGIFDKNEELAFTYAQRAAQTGMPTAEFAMGYFYEIGMFVQSDITIAKMWYKKAGEHGNKDALGRIDSISRSKTLSKKDHENIAISRIKSLHGSQRGGRPARFQDRPPPLPMATMPEVNMPEPPRHRMQGGPGPGMLSPMSPTTNKPGSRPQSIAPYPDDDAPPPRSGGSAGSQPPLSPYYNPKVRASSGGPPTDPSNAGFGIKHASTLPQQPQQYPQDPTRPSSSMGNMPTSAPGRGLAPAGRDRIASAGWEQQQPAGYRNQSPGRMVSGPPGAPLGPGSPRRPISDNSRNSSLPPNPHNSYGGDPRRGTPQSAPRPPRTDSAPPGRGGSSRPGTAQSAPPPMSQPPRTSSAMSNATQATQASAASVPVKPVKTGPQTFEEMGVPQQKQNQDCVS